MLRIRLRRQGARKQPTYRIVVADQRHARDGRFVEVIGHYNPRTEPAVAHVDEERAFHWLGNGASPSEAVARIFSWTGTQERFLRLKGGEEVSKLLAEASKAASERPAPRQTRRDAPKVAAKSKTVSDESLDEDNEIVVGDDGQQSNSNNENDETELNGSKADSDPNETEEVKAGVSAEDVSDVSVAADLEKEGGEGTDSKTESVKKDSEH